MGEAPFNPLIKRNSDIYLNSFLPFSQQNRLTRAVARVLHSGYNRDVKVERLHGWQVSTAEAREIQARLAAKVSRKNEVARPGFIAGVDISVERGQGAATAAVVVLDYPGLRLAEVKTVSGQPGFPYIPGLLSFRESPLALSAFEALSITPDLILVDGQGIAHPRRLGLASHIGLLLDTPTIGCAKSLLIGRHEELGQEPGSYAEIVDNGEVIGAALRTRRGVKPVYVSIGHKVDLQAAIRWVLECCRGHRLPEPTRLAHMAAGGDLKLEAALSPGAGRQGKSPD
ncbi:MAG: deoxyribonuclease V [Chloroflexi bacterium]|nr:deoxyribonuclease V [Chloroflexota bacterium]